MRNASSMGTILVLLTIASGCTSVKRFKSATYLGEDNTLVGIELFGAEMGPAGKEASSRNLWDLSASAQTQMIQILDKRYPDNAQFTSALNREFLQGGSGPVVDYTARDLKMVFSIFRNKDYASINRGSGTFSPADRIESVRFSLEIPPGTNLCFTGWNRYATEYGEIEIADVSFTRSLELDAEISSESVDGGLKQTVNRSEEQNVNTRYLKMSGSISDRKITIDEEGSRGIDLAGNVIADVSLRFEGFPERIAIPVYSDGPNGTGPAVTSFRFEDVLVPRIEDLPEVITANLTLEYIYRHVKAGWKTYQEWDDKVAYYSGKVSSEVPLFTKNEYVPVLYGLGSDAGGKEMVKVRTDIGKEYILQFRNYMEADRFLECMAGTAGIETGKYELRFRNQPVGSGEVSGGLKVIPVY